MPCGSSPHTRGALSITNNAGVAARIIPAYAGSTGALHGDRVDVQDHPRIRGEHVRAELPRLVVVGIIPAYAGSTRFG